ncbi:hypothetical protein [Nonomuraea sp. NPDC050540]|uniref:hypothetical protein n=1 Tax=Nonomuraea sp. NPDC050540 TaxID=3364367 RepID=UPI0037AEF285
MDTIHDIVLFAAANRDLPPGQFERQVALIKTVMTYDPGTYSWHSRLRADVVAEHAGHVITTMFEAARLYGTTVTASVEPAEPAEPPPTAGHDAAPTATEPLR